MLIELPAVQPAIPGTQPDFLFPPYVSSIARSPRMPLVLLPETLTEKSGPVFGHELIRKNDNDLTAQHEGEALGERIIVHGRVLDEEDDQSVVHSSRCGRPMPRADTVTK